MFQSKKLRLFGGRKHLCDEVQKLAYVFGTEAQGVIYERVSVLLQSKPCFRLCCLSAWYYNCIKSVNIILATVCITKDNRALETRAVQYLQHVILTTCITNTSSVSNVGMKFSLWDGQGGSIPHRNKRLSLLQIIKTGNGLRPPI